MAGFNRKALKQKLEKAKTDPPEISDEDVFEEEETPAAPPAPRARRMRSKDTTEDTTEDVYGQADDGFEIIYELLGDDDKPKLVAQLGLYDDPLAALKYLWKKQKDLSQALQAINGTICQREFVKWRAEQVSPPDRREDHDPYAYVDSNGEEVTFWESVNATKTLTRAMDELGATTPEEAAQLTSDQVLAVHGVGDARLEELEEFLAAHDLYLSDKDPNAGLADDPTDESKPATKFGESLKKPDRETQEEAVERTTGFSQTTAPRVPDTAPAETSCGEADANGGEVDANGGLLFFVFVDCAPESDTIATTPLEQFLSRSIQEVNDSLGQPFWSLDYNEGERLVVQAFLEEGHASVIQYSNPVIDRSNPLGRIFLQHIRINHPDWVIITPRR